jgi:hypothetical protein
LRAHRLLARFVQSMAGEQGERGFVGMAGQLCEHNLGGNELGFGHPQLDAEALREPAGEAEVVRVVMRHHDAPDGQAREALGDDLVPQRARGFGVEAGIHQRPAGPVAQHPQVDMVEREGQRHAQPEHARRDLLPGAAGWSLRKGKGQARITGWSNSQGRIGLVHGSRERMSGGTSAP